MSELRSAIEALRSEDLAALPDGRVEEDLAELQRASELLEAERLRRLAEVERRGGFRRDGYLSVAAWLADRFRLSWAVAREQVRLARALERMPGTRRAFADGEVSASQMRVLAAAREVDAEAFAACEEALVEAARIHAEPDLRRAVAYWRRAVEHRAAEIDERLRDRRRLHASVTVGGMVRLDGDLDPETGESVLTALRAVLDAEVRSSDPSDDRTPAQRRADALGETAGGGSTSRTARRSAASGRI